MGWKFPRTLKLDISVSLENFFISVANLTEVASASFISKQTFQRFPIDLVQVKAGNNSRKVLSEIWKIVYSLYESKEITQKVYNNIQFNAMKLHSGELRLIKLYSDISNRYNAYELKQ